MNIFLIVKFHLIKIYPYFSFYLIVDLRVNQRFHPVLCNITRSKVPQTDRKSSKCCHLTEPASPRLRTHLLTTRELYTREWCLCRNEIYYVIDRIFAVSLQDLNNYHIFQHRNHIVELCFISVKLILHLAIPINSQAEILSSYSQLWCYEETCLNKPTGHWICACGTNL